MRALIELEEFQEAKLWADKALERFPNEPELLAAKAVRTTGAKRGTKYHVAGGPAKAAKRAKKA